MRAPILCATALLVLMVSCKKDMKSGMPVPPVTTPVNIPDNSPPRLKDMIVNRLPSPYFHFDYNDSGYITGANWQSGLRIYDVRYSGKKINEMENLIEPVRDKLEYVYDNGKVIQVNIINRNQVTYRKLFIRYTASNRLSRLYWEVLEAGGFSSEQILDFTYHPDGNLKELSNTTFPVGPLIEGTVIDHFDNYDDKINADGFSLLLPPVQNHLILLPDYKLQINNPRHIVRTGSGLDYNVDYSYTYDAHGRPVSKTGDILFTTGQFTGQHFTSSTSFSWY